MGNKITAGKASVEFDQNLESFYTKFLNTVAPEASKIMKDSLEQIKREAQAEWPKRQPTIRKDKEGKIVFYRDNSKNSWAKFRIGIRVTAKDQIEAYLRNDAPYSWAIKFGYDSVTNTGAHITRPRGARVSNELMIKPLRKTSNSVVQALAEDLQKKAGK